MVCTPRMLTDCELVLNHLANVAEIIAGFLELCDYFSEDSSLHDTAAYIHIVSLT